ncbi:MAG: hypothetical protein JWM91_3031 [Rhodospirillales bacterium]|nr:hypothetical protein [Rhodospirillales bacterium]
MADSIHHARERLPTAVHDLALRLGVNSDFNRSIVRLRQAGRMKPVGATRWMSFTARQTISTRLCAFDWRARTGPFGVISVRDALQDGQGRLDVTALGIIRLSRAEHSSALIRGELMRYLAELAWAPDAILLNTRLRWRVDGPDRLIVTAGEGETAAEVVLNLDSQGRIAGGFAPDRPRSATVPLLPTPWRGRFSNYRQHDNLWLPFTGEVSWEIEGKMEVYWQGHIMHWESPSAAGCPSG